MAGQMRAAVYAAIGAVRWRQVGLEGLDRRPRRAGGGLACHPTDSVTLTHECLLATNQSLRQVTPSPKCTMNSELPLRFMIDT